MTDTVEELKHDLTRYIDMSIVMQKEIDDLRAALVEIKEKGATVGYGRAALRHIANEALKQ